MRRDPIIEEKNLPRLFGIAAFIRLKKRGCSEFYEQYCGANQQQRTECDAMAEMRKANVSRGGRCIYTGVD
jgi:hypothetical protein